MRHTISRQVLRRRLALLATLTVVGCSSEDAVTDPGAITLLLVPTSAIILQGGTVAVAATVTRSGGFTGPVVLTLSGLPIGGSSTVSGLQTTGAVTTAVVTITVAATTTSGGYNLVLRGAGSGVEATAAFALTVAVTDGSFEQGAASATASSQYTVDDWSAGQATGQPNVTGCADDPRAWASTEANGVDWLELTYSQSVRPREVRIHETFGAGSIVKVEVKEAATGIYRSVYSALPASQTCPRVLVIPVTGIATGVKVVRLSLDQRLLNTWNEIDAVRLVGDPFGDWDYLVPQPPPKRPER